MEWNRVWALGRDTYVRLYPNPGVGLCMGKYRIALSWFGGLEIFKSHPERVWCRCWSVGDRRKR